MKWILGFLLLILLNACAVSPVQESLVFKLADRQNLQSINKWFLTGRLAIINEKNSETVYIDWQHTSQQELIELSGPLAQGRVIISIMADQVEVDDGHEKKRYQGPADEIISELVGAKVPYYALKFWVLGVNEPQVAVNELENGFVQDGWIIKYSDFQLIDKIWLPKKINAIKSTDKLKLVIDHWEI